MNQAGLFIPAQEGSLLPIYENIYAIIGDDQSIQYNLSTFSSYITQLSSFLDIISELYIKFYNNELGSAEHLISKLDEYYGIIESYDMGYLKLSFLYCQSKDTDRLEDLEDKLNRLLIFYPDKMELLGLLADIRFDLGKFEDAMKLYNQVKDESKNGMLLLHINERLSMTY